MKKKINILAAREQDEDVKWSCDNCECDGYYDCGECTGYTINEGEDRPK